LGALCWGCGGPTAEDGSVPELIFSVVGLASAPDVANPIHFTLLMLMPLSRAA